jgi:AcrR family transcriptional regulator
MGFEKMDIRGVIAEKAKDILLVKTPEKVTMSMVAKQLDVTAVTLYQYFDGKNEIIRAGYERILSEISECIDLKLPVTLSSHFRLKIILKNLADYFYRTGLKATFLVEDPTYAPISFRFIRIPVMELLRDWLKCDDDTAERYSYLYLSLLQSEIIHYRRVGEPIPDDIIEDIFDLVKKT